jgi:hypothetical protein
MVDKRLRDYIEVCPKCGYNHVAKWGKNKFKCKNYHCQHVFPKGKVNYTSPIEKRDRSILQLLDNAIIEVIESDEPVVIDKLYSRRNENGILKKVYNKLKDILEDDELIPPNTTIVNRIRAIAKGWGKGYFILNLDGKLIGNKPFYELKVPCSRQHY